MFLMFQKKFQNTRLQVAVLFIMFLMFQMFHSLKEALPTRPPLSRDSISPHKSKNCGCFSGINGTLEHSLHYKHLAWNIMEQAEHSLHYKHLAIYL